MISSDKTELSSLNISTPSLARRPGRPKSEEKADAIREAAASLFLTEGMSKTSMDAVAQAAGVSKQTVYSHFNSKDDLFRACVATKVHMYGLDAAHCDPALPVDEALCRVGVQFMTLLSDPEVVQMFRLIIAEATAFPRVAGMFYETGPRATVEYVSRLFAHYLKGGADEGKAAQAAKEFLALVKSDCLVEKLLGVGPSLSEEDIAEHVRNSVDRIRSLYDLNDR